MSGYIKLHDLEVFQLARELSKLAWQIYKELNWNNKKTMGDQFLRATDSVGANIVEGYGRYHYLDKVKFFYNSRASLSESKDNWLELLNERGLIKDKELYNIYKTKAEKCSIKLQNFIKANYRAKNNH